MVTKIGLYAADSGLYVTKFRLFYSDDGVQWHGYTTAGVPNTYLGDILPGNTKEENVISYALSSPGIKVR